MQTPAPEQTHHPEYVRAIREAAERLEWQYTACFQIALATDQWTQETRDAALAKGTALLGAASDILSKIGEEPALITEEKRRRAAEASA